MPSGHGDTFLQVVSGIAIHSFRWPSGHSDNCLKFMLSEYSEMYFPEDFVFDIMPHGFMRPSGHSVILLQVRVDIQILPSVSSFSRVVLGYMAPNFFRWPSKPQSGHVNMAFQPGSHPSTTTRSPEWPTPYSLVTWHHTSFLSTLRYAEQPFY
jgi:hypothetical protein